MGPGSALGPSGMTGEQETVLKTNVGNYFEDFRIGQKLAHATPRTLTVGDQALYTAMRLMLEQMPVQAARLAPFVSLRKFLSHEQEFLAGVRVLIAV